MPAQLQEFNMSDIIDREGIDEDTKELEYPSGDILNAEQKEYILAYLQKEIGDTKAEAGREKRIERNLIIDRQRRIQPEHETKDFPWDGAANTVPPLMWTKISSVVSKFVQAILNKDPLFVYESEDADRADHAMSITKFIKKLTDDPNQAGFRKAVWPLEFDKASFGTVFVKVPFEVEERYFTVVDPETGTMTERTQKVRSCPKPYIINFEDFFTRPHWNDIQKAPWIGVREYKYFHQLKTLEAQQFYTDVDQVWARNSSLDENKVASMANAGITEEINTADQNKQYEIFEVNMFFDIKGNGRPQDIIIHYEHESNTILRVEYNTLGRRDIARIPYVEFARLLYGMGIGDMVSNLQVMIESVFNNSFNSDELSYMGLLVTRQGSGLEFGKDIYPGATVAVPNPAEDLNLFKFPSVTPQAMMLENKIQSYADQATGATSMMVGQQAEGEGNRIGATGTQFLAAQGNAYLEAFLELAVNGYQEIGELMLLQLVRNKDYVDISSMPESDKILIQEILDTPVEEIAGKFKFNVSMADIQQETRERQQALIQLFGLYGGFMDKLAANVAMMSSQEMSQPGMERMQEVLATTFVGMSKLFERILENFDEKEIGDLLPFYSDMEVLLAKADKEKEAMVERIKLKGNSETAGSPEQGSIDGPAVGGPQNMGGGIPDQSQIGPGGPQAQRTGEDDI